MMVEDKRELIQHLTGVKSSKINYYTELKRMNEELIKKNIQLEIINDVTKNLKVNMSIHEFLSHAIKKLQKIIRFDRLSLSLYEKNELRLANVYPEDAFFLEVGSPLPKKNSLYWRVVKEQRAVYVKLNETTQKLSDVEQETLKQLGIQTIFIVPLISSQEIIGVLSFGSHEEMDWPDSDRLFLMQIADQLAVCIKNVRLYEEVLRAKKQWEDTFRAVDDMLIVFDLEEQIVRFNEAVKHFFQKEDKDLLGMKFRDLFLECTREDPYALVESFHTKQVASCEIRLLNHRTVEVHTYPVWNDADEMYGLIAYVKDVTEKRKIEAQLLHSGKLAAIGEMAAGVAHEINSPLTVILGNSQLLLRQMNRSDPNLKLIEDIELCGNRCKHIVRNLLSYSRQDETYDQEVSLNRAINEVLSIIRYQIERNGISLHIDLDNQLPSFQGNLQQIEQIFINLLLNAKDALDGSERVNKKIMISTGRGEDHHGEAFLYLTVRDNGIGMSLALQSEVFQPFFTTKDQRGGTGLGLAISQEYARANGGKITVESEEGEGSTFHVTFSLR